MRMTVIIDVSNLYYTLRDRYKQSRLSYSKLFDFLKGMGTIEEKHAFGTNKDDEAAAFIKALKNLGVITHFKTPKEYHNGGHIRHKSDWDVGMAIEMVRQCEGESDTIILCTADSDLAPAVEYCHTKGKKVIIFACGISSDLRETADEHFEIPQSFLENH